MIEGLKKSCIRTLFIFLFKLDVYEKIREKSGRRVERRNARCVSERATTPGLPQREIRGIPRRDALLLKQPTERSLLYVFSFPTEILWIQDVS